MALVCAQLGMRFVAVMPEGRQQRARAHHQGLRRRNLRY